MREWTCICAARISETAKLKESGMKRALLLSASSYKDSGYLNHCKGWIKEFLGGLWEDEILFIPFAGVRRTSEQYEQKVADCLESNNIRSIHHFSDMKAAVKNAKSICIGGGNTFVLLNELYKFDLLGAIKRRWTAVRRISAGLLAQTSRARR